jgi:hypothetical protein
VVLSAHKIQGITEKNDYAFEMLIVNLPTEQTKDNSRVGVSGIIKTSLNTQIGHWK